MGCCASDDILAYSSRVSWQPFLIINKTKNTSTLNEDAKVMTTALWNNTKVKSLTNQFCFSRHQQTAACSQSQPLPCFCTAMSQEWFYVFKWLGKTQKKYLVTHTSDNFILQCPQIKFDWNTFVFLGLLLSMLFLLYNGNVE